MSASSSIHPSTPPEANGSSKSQSGGPLRSGVGGIAILHDVEVEVTVEIGRRRMKIAEILRLSEGQTLELGKAAGEPLDIFVNGQLLGRGEAVVVGDCYAVRIVELISPEQESS